MTSHKETHFGFQTVAEDDKAATGQLLQEFDDMLNIAGDPLPANAKLGWWGEELRSWAGQRSRHPLGRALEPVRAPWTQLADALPSLIDARDRVADAAQARLLLSSNVAMAYAQLLRRVVAGEDLGAEVRKGLPTREQIQHSPEFYQQTGQRGVESLKALFKRGGLANVQS